MTTRILTPEEWPEALAGTELEDVWPHLLPEKAQILVVEKDGKIVACWAAMRVVHLEGIWIDPSCRKSLGVGRRLIEGMRQLVCAERSVFTSATTPEVARLIQEFGGVELDGRHFVMRMS